MAVAPGSIVKDFNVIEDISPMGMRCVAEGIETREEWEHMRKLGFDLGQGYLIGRPAPAEKLAGWRFAAGMAGHSTDTNAAG